MNKNAEILFSSKTIKLIVCILCLSPTFNYAYIEQYSFSHVDDVFLYCEKCEYSLFFLF